jgi:hypothetical protein
MAITGPFTDWSHTYPYVQIETDIGGSSNLCDPATGADCTAPRSTPTSTRSTR